MKAADADKNLEIQKSKPRRGPTKKSSILEIWEHGTHDIWLIAKGLQTKPSYVASVLQGAGLIHGYFDLYITPDIPVNIYSERMQDRLGFRTLPIANRSIRYIDLLFKKFEEQKDRAGQHHCLVAALTMYNRARSCGKITEGEVFRRWLFSKLAQRDFGPMLPQ